MMQRSGGYGCSGPIPGAPEGANMVSGAMGGVPVFSNVGGQPVRQCGEVKPLPANSRHQLPDLQLRHRRRRRRHVSTASNQAGFVISPAGSCIVGEVNPLVDRPEGTNPYFN